MATLTAWRQFVASVPEAQREFRTVEISHPQLSQTYRFVASYTDVSLALESGAPRDAGQTVVFTASTLRITEPAERQDSEQSLIIEFGNVDGRIHDIIDQISGDGFFTPAQIVYRKYYSGDLSEPAVTPLYLSASSVAFDGPTAVSVVAEDSDLAQKRSGSLYTVEQFPGLAE